MYVQLNKAMIATTSPMPGWMSPNRHPCSVVPQTAASPMARSRIGSDITMSTVLEMTVSTAPPKNPAMNPRPTNAILSFLNRPQKSCQGVRPTTDGSTSTAEPAAVTASDWTVLIPYETP